MKCPECKQLMGSEWMVHYHKMDCSTKRYQREGDRWREIIYPEPEFPLFWTGLIAIAAFMALLLWPHTGYTEGTPIPDMKGADVIFRMDNVSMMCWIARTPELKGETVCHFKPNTNDPPDIELLEDVTARKVIGLRAERGRSKEVGF